MSGNFEQITKPYLDTKIDQISENQGSVDAVPALSLDIPDPQIITNLNNRIQDAQGYWEEPKGFDLKASRAKNVKMYLGRQVDEGQLYRFQIPYQENQIFKSMDAIMSYVTSQPPVAEVYPAQDTDQSRILAKDLEKGLLGWAESQDLVTVMETAIMNLMLKRIGIFYFWFDPDYGKNGDIMVEAVDPNNVIIDKNARRGENPAFICLVRKDSVEQLCYRFPAARKKIYEEVGIKRETPKQMSQTIIWRQVWITHYDKKGNPQEGCVSYFGKLVLSKYKDPNWLYATPEKNFLDTHQKPFIAINYINDGSHWIDSTTVVEQASWIQEVLNKRGRQIMENADTANGFMVISSDAMSFDDAENITGDPNQKIVIDTNGMPIQNLIDNIEGRDLPSYVVEDKADLRNVIGDLMGTPSQFSGDENNQTDTLGQAIMIKNQASGRQDRLVRAVDKAADQIYKFVTQMMVVHYTEKHFKTVNGNDGEFDHIVLHRDLIEEGTAVRVKAGSTLPFDKSREEAITLNLVKDGLLAPLDVYKGLHMPNPQKLYDNWAKYKTDPMSLARETLDQMQDTQAYVEYVEILAGKKVEPYKEADIAHILAHRKQMLTGEFIEAAKKSKKIMKNMMDHVTEEVNSVQLRTDLDQMSQQGAQALLPTNPPAQPIMPPAPPPIPTNPMMPPGQPGAPQPPQPQQPLAAPSVGQVMGGPGMAPPPTPSPVNPTALPMV